MTSERSALSLDIRTRLPKRVEGIDMRSLAIGPQEAFVMSRIDGNSSESDIAAATGLDLDSVLACLERLKHLGAIDYPGNESESSDNGATAASSRPASVQPAVPQSPLPWFSVFDPKELDEEADIPRERKQQILETFYALEELSHYELLQVTPDADKKAIKAAYFKVVNVFHPDRYFGKNLGSFKTKLERVFSRMTEAQDVLTRKGTREEYDAYLTTKQHTTGHVANQRAILAAVKQVQAKIEQEAKEQQSPSETAPPSQPAQGFSQRPRPLVSPRNSDPVLRKKALARKLRGASLTFRASGSVPAVGAPFEGEAPVSREVLRERVDGDLKARYQNRLQSAKQRQVQHYIEAADKARADGDAVSALNSLRIAAELDPHNDRLLKRVEAAQLAATRVLADSYLQQAEYEEREGHFARAADNFEKAALGKDSSSLYDRAASCLLQTGEDLKRAGELARKAVELAPDYADYRITLARVYVAAKMLNSAVNEAERAVRLAPHSESINNWLKRIKRGEL